MTTFAEALARIEVLSKEPGPLSIYYNIPAHRELLALLEEHADSIVQLGRVVERMHEFILYTQCYDSCVDDYIKLMKGE